MVTFRYLCFTFWLGTILVLSLTPVPDIDAPPITDKVVHFVMYFLTALVFYGTFHRKYRKVIIYASIFSAFYGAFIEVLQYFVPYRSFSLGDILANCLGAICAGILIHFFLKYTAQKNIDDLEKVE